MDMATAQDRPTLGERYSAATESSDLAVKPTRADVDYLIAAGYAAGLGPALYRLQAEFLLARPALDATHRWARKQFEMADELRKQKHEEQAKQVSDAARASIKTEYVVALINLRSLREVRDQWGPYAIGFAERQRFTKKEYVIRIIAGRVLDLWIDPRCEFCGGRGFTGGEHRGEMQGYCRPCHGAGLRRPSVGNDDSERLFAGRLLLELDKLASDAQGDIRRALRWVEEAKQIIGRT